MGIKLKKYQQIPVDFMKENRGLILFHSTGSGKTITSLMAMSRFQDQIIIIGSRSSKKAFMDDIDKLKLNVSQFKLFSYKKLKNMLYVNPTIFKNTSVILDEAHNLRSETKENIMIVDALIFANRIMVLTATPIVNYVNDLAVLINIVKFKHVIPTEKSLFNMLYVDEDNMMITGESLFEKKIQNCISYYEHKDDENYPIKIERTMEIEMDHDQLNEYSRFVRELVTKGIVKNIHDFDIYAVDKKVRNFFLSSTRQLSNSVNGHVSPKIQAIYEHIKTGNKPVVVYSNFLKNGIFPLVTLFEKDNITYKTITGSTSEDKLNYVVNNYNNGKYDVLLISSAGSESLDLKNTRQIHIMEPHWNDAKITQVIGRAVRYKSHSELPKKDRNVEIFRWSSIFPKNIVKPTADKYLMEMSERKTEMIQNVIKIIKKASIENNSQKGGSDIYYNKYLNR